MMSTSVNHNTSTLGPRGVLRYVSDGKVQRPFGDLKLTIRGHFGVRNVLVDFFGQKIIFCQGLFSVLIKSVSQRSRFYVKRTLIMHSLDVFFTSFFYEEKKWPGLFGLIRTSPSLLYPSIPLGHWSDLSPDFLFLRPTYQPIHAFT